MNKLLTFLQGNPFLTLVLCMMATLLLYGNTLNHEFVLDDALVIEQNRYVQEGFGGIAQVFQHSHTEGATRVEDNGYRPIPLTFFAIIHQFTGNSTGAYHLLNVLLYGLVIGLFLQWLWLLRERIPPQVSFVVAVLFFVHPLHTEVVANVKGLEDILVFGGAVGMMHLLHRYAIKGRPGYLVGSVVVFCLALITKETAVTFLALVPAYLFIVTRSEVKKVAMISLVFLAAFAVVWWLRSIALGNIEEVELTVLNNALVAIEGRFDQLTTALWMHVRYLQLFAFPVELSSDYSYNHVPEAGLATLRGIAGLLMTLAFAALTVYGLWKRQLWAFGLLLYAATFSLVSNTVFLIGATMAERFLFIPIAGLLLAMAIGINDLVPKTKRSWIPFVVVPIMLLFAYQTVTRNKDWETTRTLLEADLETAPNSSRLLANNAKFLFEDAKVTPNPAQRQQTFMEARSLFLKSVEILPSNHDGWYNLGLLESTIGNKEAALQAYIECVKHAPEFALAYNNLGVIYFNMQKLDLAIPNLIRAYELSPSNPDIASNRGLVEHSQQNYSEAIRYYEQALELDPMHLNSVSNLMKIHARLGNEEQAQFYQSRLAGMQGR